MTAALDMALGTRTVTPGLICHSDRGSQYGSEDVQAMVARYQLRGSMSCKGNCWDNAVVESFFATPDLIRGRGRCSLAMARRGEERRRGMD